MVLKIPLFDDLSNRNPSRLAIELVISFAVQRRKLPRLRGARKGHKPETALRSDTPMTPEESKMVADTEAYSSDPGEVAAHKPILYASNHELQIPHFPSIPSGGVVAAGIGPSLQATIGPHADGIHPPDGTTRRQGVPHGPQ
jgi:hypothetical protein